MRKLLFITAAAAALLTASGASADSFQHTVNLSATADLSCSFTGTTSRNGAFQQDSDAVSSFLVPIGSSGVPETSGSLTFSNAVCNGNHTSVKLERDGLIAEQASSPVAGFSNKIDYTAGVSWGGGAEFLSMDANSNLKEATVGARNGNLVLNIHVPASPGPFIAGAYHDALVLKIQPTI